jgi:hypothetical protein
MGIETMLKIYVSLLVILRPFLEAASCSGTQKLPNILCSSKDHKDPPLDPIGARIPSHPMYHQQRYVFI